MDIKERIDTLSETEAKCALAWLLNYAVENTMCPVDDEDVCKAESKDACKMQFLSFAIEEGKQ